MTQNNLRLTLARGEGKEAIIDGETYFPSVAVPAWNSDENQMRNNNSSLIEKRTRDVQRLN